MAIDSTLFNLLLQGGFAALFIWLLAVTQKSNSERENRLMAALDKYADAAVVQSAASARTVDILSKIELRLERIEERIAERS